MGFDCPILDISDSKMGKVGLAILVDMSTNMAPTMEGDRHLKLTRNNMKCWKQPSIYAWPIVNSKLKIIDGAGLLIFNDLAKSVYNFITTVQSEGNGMGSANRSEFITVAQMIESSVYICFCVSFLLTIFQLNMEIPIMVLLMTYRWLSQNG
jgi:hypothetical protein